MSPREDSSHRRLPAFGLIQFSCRVLFIAFVPTDRPSRFGSKRVNVDNRLRKRLGRLLRQIVSNAALDEPEFVFAREFFGVRAWLRMWRAIGVTFHRDRRHTDNGTLCQPRLKLVILRLAVSETDAPTVVVNYDLDVIRIIESGGRTIEGRVVELPGRRSLLPDELVKVVPVFLVAGPA